MDASPLPRSRHRPPPQIRLLPSSPNFRTLTFFASALPREDPSLLGKMRCWHSSVDPNLFPRMLQVMNDHQPWLSHQNPAEGQILSLWFQCSLMHPIVLPNTHFFSCPKVAPFTSPRRKEKKISTRSAISARPCYCPSSQVFPATLIIHSPTQRAPSSAALLLLSPCYSVLSLPLHVFVAPLSAAFIVMGRTCTSTWQSEDHSQALCVVESAQSIVLGSRRSREV